MEGFTIPIEGDTDPFRAALRELRSAIDQLAAALGAQARAGAGAGRSTARGLDQVLSRASNAGNAVMGLAAGLGVAGKAAKWLGTVKMGGGISGASSGTKWECRRRSPG